MRRWRWSRQPCRACGGDPDSGSGPDLDRDGPYRYAPRDTGPRAAGPARASPGRVRRRSFHFSGAQRIALQGFMARRDRHVALRKKARTGTLHLAVGEGRRGLDFCLRDVLFARRNRLAEPPGNMASAHGRIVAFLHKKLRDSEGFML